jgi:hypothetical protein
MLVLGNIFYTVSYRRESAMNTPLDDTPGVPALYPV